MPIASQRIAVLGAGLQGTCLALELATRGARVDLYERNDECLSETSANNEGKIHLGLVYAGDRSLATAQMMLAGGLSFEPLMRRWIGGDIQSVPVSPPFEYVVHRQGQVSTDEFLGHAWKIAALAAESLAGSDAAYFGHDPRTPVRPLTSGELEGRYDRASIAAAYQTSEIGIDTEALARLLRRRLAEDPAIQCLTGRTVSSVGENGSGLSVTSTSGESEDRETYDWVANTLWTSRLAIDQTMGIEPARPWLFRWRHFVRARLSDEFSLPSVSMVLGPFGDIVTYPNGRIFLSWYPAGMTLLSREIAPPARTQVLGSAANKAMRDATVTAIAGVVPALATTPLSDEEVKGGWVFAWGESDIDDPASRLHERHAIGVHRHGRYLSIDTGKLTTAPLFARIGADQIENG